MRFTWEAFDLTFLKSIIEASDINDKDIYLETDDKDIVIGCITNNICSLPDSKFISEYRNIIDNVLLPKYDTQVDEICKALYITERSRNGKLITLCKKKTTTTLVRAYEAALYSISGLAIQPQDYSTFKYTKSLDMKSTKIEEVPLYDFQEDAVSALKKHFIDSNEKKGMLVMPTGSGKSRTSTYFLIKEMVSRGYQIIWLAHRHMLIEQAADCFYRFAGLSKLVNPDIKSYQISCVSGEHLRMSQIDNHEIIIASINSVYRNKAHLARILGKTVMLVVDECHHTFAPSYQEVIKFIENRRPEMKLLGITATPVRANDDDSAALMNLYGNNIVYTISLSELIKTGILANPKFERIETEEEIEPIISIDEKKFINRYGDLPESLVNKIADSASRNKVIIEQYINNKDKYGKTLIFALNVVHCRFLYEELKKRNIRVGHIYSRQENNTEVINAFKNNDLDVLINVNIMTEGTDVPDIQTIFLTRPTQSEGLLMQMIGRGMRGQQSSNGTEDVNIVDFHDKWAIFRKWLNPEWLINEEREDSDPEKKVHKRVSYKEYEWSKCQEIYRNILVYNKINHRDVMIPSGWYSLCDEDGETVCMLVFENQLDAFNRLYKDKSSWINDTSISAEDLIDKYFPDFIDKPTLNDMKLFVENFRQNEITPNIHIISHRKQIDPHYVAQRASLENRDVIDLAGELYDEYDIARDLFETKEMYQEAVSKAKIYQHKNIIVGQKIEELPIEWIPFDRTPYHDLQKLANEVIDEMFDGVSPDLGKIAWTSKAYKGFYGRFWHDSHNIDINCVLNSKDVDPEVIKFILYHEMLHREFSSHDKIFRIEEQKYPKYEYHQHFLEDTMNKFDIKEW